MLKQCSLDGKVIVLCVPLWQNKYALPLKIMK